MKEKGMRKKYVFQKEYIYFNLKNNLVILLYYMREKIINSNKLLKNVYFRL